MCGKTARTGLWGSRWETTGSTRIRVGRGSAQAYPAADWNQGQSARHATTGGETQTTCLEPDRHDAEKTCLSPTMGAWSLRQPGKLTRGAARHTQNVITLRSSAQLCHRACAKSQVLAAAVRRLKPATAVRTSPATDKAMPCNRLDSVGRIGTSACWMTSGWEAARMSAV